LEDIINKNFESKTVEHIFFFMVGNS